MENNCNWCYEPVHDDGVYCMKHRDRPAPSPLPDLYAVSDGRFELAEPCKHGKLKRHNTNSYGGPGGPMGPPEWCEGAGLESEELENGTALCVCGHPMNNHSIKQSSCYWAVCDCPKAREEDIA